MKKFSFGQHRSSGFTMPELITVIVILGLLAAVAAPRFFDVTAFNQRGSHDQVIASLRYAQKEAIAQHGFVCVAFAANSITLTTGQTNTCGTPLTSPSGGAYVVQANFSTLPNFSFDCAGIPRTTGLGTCADANGVLTSDQSVQVQGAAAITVTRETGFVY